MLNRPRNPIIQPSINTSLKIFAINSYNTLQGPTSVKWVAPLAAITCTLCVYITNDVLGHLFEDPLATITCTLCVHFTASLIYQVPTYGSRFVYGCNYHVLVHRASSDGQNG